MSEPPKLSFYLPFFLQSPNYISNIVISNSIIHIAFFYIR